MKYLSLFSGIGSPEFALKNIGVNFELIDFSEIDKYAIQSYCAIHNINTNLNLGDISKIDINSLPKDIDLITHGSPCQSFSKNGNNEGGDEGSGTKSSLMWHTVNIVEHSKPKFIIWENVRNILSPKHIHNFEKYLNRMKDLGYVNHFKILNSKNFGIPQNRERVFVVSIRKDINTNFKFPNEYELNIKLKDILEQSVDNKFYIDIDRDYFGLIEDISIDKNIKEFKVRQATKLGYDIAKDGNSINLEQPKSKTRRGRVGKGIINTLTTSCNYAVVCGDQIRRITPLESWRLMGFTDNAFNMASIVSSENQLYKQAGNSIVVNVMEEIFKELLK